MARDGAAATTKEMKSPSLLRRLSSRFIGGFEYLFYQHGYTVCRHPYLYIGTVLAVTTACGIGLLSFHQENRPFKLWIPQESDFVQTYDWMQENYPREFRFENAIVTADNVLEPAVILEMLRVHQRVSAPPPGTGPSWSDVCARLPSLASSEDELSEEEQEVVDSGLVESSTASTEDMPAESAAPIARRRRRRNSQRPDFDVSGYDDFDPSVSLPSSWHCALVEGIERPCWEASLLELWAFKADRVAALTREDVLRAVNTVTNSPVFGYRFNISRYLGGVRRNSTGHVTSAGAAFFAWAVRRDPDADHVIVSDSGTGDSADENTLLFENHFLSVLSSAPQLPGVTWYYSAGKSFGEISNSTIFSDVKYLVLGYVVMFAYIQMMLGRCNLVEHRTYLSIIGVASVGLAVIISFGLCSALGVFFGPVHNILPLLLLGLGVDDMFVVVQCWETLSPDDRLQPLPERVGKALQHAGVSITVTSLTDFVAFGIGAFTVLPSLQSFCIYAAVGILAVYFIQATWFVAWFTLDQRRIEARRDGIVPCYQHSRRWVPNECSQRNFFQNFFSRVYAPAVLSRPGKAAVLVVTCGLLAVNAYGLSQLRQEFNPLWFLPTDSYLSKYHQNVERFFPNEGHEGVVFLSGLHLADNLPQMALLSERLRAEPSVERVDSWYDEFQYYINYNEYGELPQRFADGYEFLPLLGQFMFSPRGGKFQSFLRFNGTLECGEPAPPVTASMITYTHKLLDGPRDQIPAMLRVKDLVSSINFTGDAALVQPLAEAYASWETDQVIEHELYRNMGLALLCVFTMVLLLIANLTVCLLVLSCVVLTLVDVGGLMFFWGLTIDTVSCIDVVLAIGLCVDYAAHVGHTFLTERGDRNQRAADTLRDIGPAVFNGGFSTFLAFIFLATSTSHVFITFFKVFFGVTVYGLFHGLVLLPVLLSLIGPDPYLPTRTEIEMTSREVKRPTADGNGCSDGGEPQQIQTDISEVKYTPTSADGPAVAIS